MPLRRLLSPRSGAGDAPGTFWEITSSAGTAGAVRGGGGGAGVARVRGNAIVLHYDGAGRWVWVFSPDDEKLLTHGSLVLSP